MLSGRKIRREPVICRGEYAPGRRARRERPRTTHRSMYDAVGGVAGEDFVKSLLVFESLSLRARGQVGGDECVHDGAVFERVRVQIVQQPPLSGLEAGAEWCATRAPNRNGNP